MRYLKKHLQWRLSYVAPAGAALCQSISPDLQVEEIPTLSIHLLWPTACGLGSSDIWGRAFRDILLPNQDHKSICPGCCGYRCQRLAAGWCREHLSPWARWGRPGPGPHCDCWLILDWISDRRYIAIRAVSPQFGPATLYNYADLKCIDEARSTNDRHSIRTYVRPLSYTKQDSIACCEDTCNIAKVMG
jgi:hypothetical protein